MSEDLFDLGEKYEAMLQQGLRLSGENQDFFVQGRLADLLKQLPAGWSPRRILDFGCGIGGTTRQLAIRFPEAAVVGLDSAPNALRRAQGAYASSQISFGHTDELPSTESFDLCYSNGVFHHIEPSRRLEVLTSLSRSTVREGYLALFENNPWNPGTRLVMRRIPFDCHAVPFSSRQARRSVRQAGYRREVAVRYLFCFPHALSCLRFAEPCLAGLPLGAQYYILAQK